MESNSPLKKKMIYMAARRAMPEVERILERFLSDRLDHMDDKACERVINFLHHQTDIDLLNWLFGIEQPHEGVDKEILAWFSEYRSEVDTIP